MTDIDLIESLGLSQKESQQLADLFKNKNKSKISVKDRNKLINKLSGGGQQQPKETETKNINDMDEQEKKEHLNNLKKKLKNKTNTMKKTRTSKPTNVKPLETNTNDMLSNAIQSLLATEETKNTATEETKNTAMEDNLEDYLI